MNPRSANFWRKSRTRERDRYLEGAVPWYYTFTKEYVKPRRFNGLLPFLRGDSNLGTMSARGKNIEGNKSGQSENVLILGQNGDYSKLLKKQGNKDGLVEKK